MPPTTSFDPSAVTARAVTSPSPLPDQVVRAAPVDSLNAARCGWLAPFTVVKAPPTYTTPERIVTASAARFSVAFHSSAPVLVLTAARPPALLLPMLVNEPPTTAVVPSTATASTGPLAFGFQGSVRPVVRLTAAR